MALSLLHACPMGLLSSAPVMSAPARANVQMIAGQDYTPEETAAILENQPASFVIGGKGVPLDWTTDEISDSAGLAKLATKLNPAVGYWDPFEIGEVSKEMVGWFRHAEIKHGRVAMAGFVGFVLQLNGVHWPWKLQAPLYGVPDVPAISFADISAAGGPLDQWDAVPSAGKLQILLMIGCFEAWGESSEALKADGQMHYVRGGKPGYFPTIKDRFPHPVPFDFFDPFGFTKKLSAEEKETKLLAEINNGRLAMIGLMGLISASKGCIVPGLDSLGLPQYAGEPMAFFSSANTDLPFVADMLATIK